MPETAWFETPPDWICEVLSSSTARYDNKRIQKSEKRFSDKNARLIDEKRQIYADFGVSHLWFVDPDNQTQEAFELRGKEWVLIATLSGEADVAVAPFAAVPFELGTLWEE